ncbi:MAG: hypothetical protein PHV18_05020 [Lachnospiraceae bacterium]|nr:hypothetical protein [Lachnospiraceae bacterium]
MVAHGIFAQVFEGEVKNVNRFKNYPDADYITKCVFGLEAQAIDCVYIPVTEGDKYHDGCFWRVDLETGNEVRIDPIPNESQEIEKLKAENEELILALAEIMGGVEA